MLSGTTDSNNMQQLAKLKIKLATQLLSSAAIIATMAIEPTKTTTSRCTRRPAASRFCCYLSQGAIILLLLSALPSQTTSVQVISGSSDLAHHHSAVLPSSGTGNQRQSNQGDKSAAVTTSASDSPILSDMKTMGLPDMADRQPKKGRQQHLSAVGSNTTTMGLSVASTNGVVYGEDDTTAASDSSADDNNTTLIIDYDQQGYQLGQTTRKSSSTTLVAVESTTVAPTTESRGAAAGDVTGIADRGLTRSDSGTGELGAAYKDQDPYRESATTRDSVRRLRSAAGDKLRQRLNASSLSTKQLKDEQNLYKALLRKTPYSKHWTPERKWDETFKRFVVLANKLKESLAKSLIADAEYYADVSISQACADDIRWVQEYQKRSSNHRWLLHMVDATGKNEPGLLTGQFAHLGHVIQCVKVRAPGVFSNDSFDERYFERQTEQLGEKFRGKYCLASIRPVLPERPRLVSRFSELIDSTKLSNISYLGESSIALKGREGQMKVPELVREQMAQQRQLNWLDGTPFESELYQYMIAQRNFMFNLPRVMGVCYPSSCSRDDVRASLQKTMNEQHQVVDVEFDCETEEVDAWKWFTLPRLMVYVFLALVTFLTFGASLTRYILVDKLRLRSKLLRDDSRSRRLFGSLFASLDAMSMDKCAGILFVKTKRATPIVDETKSENLRSTTIDALKGCLVLLLIYSELVHLGGLPVPFMWAKWNDAMFPFYRSLATQPFLNAPIWSEAFYMISAYLIGAKLLENHRRHESSSSVSKLANGFDDVQQKQRGPRSPDFGQFVMRRYARLVPPMVAFMTMNYVWPRLSNGFVMMDQANKLLEPCDRLGWTNLLLFHNHRQLNDTCLWPSHVSAAFFQLHLLSYPILLLMLFALRTGSGDSNHQRGSQSELGAARKLLHFLLKYAGFGLAAAMAALGLLYPAYQASREQLIVPFLVDYLDYDNYRRVIESTLMPTHNHLASYMLGLALAYLAVSKRAKRERRRQQQRYSTASSTPNYLEPEGSPESVVSTPSTTQGLHFRRPTSEGANNLVSLTERPRTFKSSSIVEEDYSSEVQEGREQSWSSWISSTLTTSLVAFLLLISLSASWFWNGLGQPMSSTQTFWYMVATKLLFNLTFAYLFYKHFATRRNSNEPWMITRFLVPIGRMSLAAFYTSWLVIWFDLLTSLYQWHPSHYFVTEKFYEIIFITLVMAMFVYGAFEGTIKLVEIGKRNRRLRQLPLDKIPPTCFQGFESFFLPKDDADSNEEAELAKDCGDGSFPVGTMTNSNQQQQLMATSAADGHNKMLGGYFQSRPGDNGSGSRALAAQTKATSGDGKLSIIDQYKLNAELRANYSFASIGLYETAPGAVDEFTHPAIGCDPQMSSHSESSHARGETGASAAKSVVGGHHR